MMYIHNAALLFLFFFFNEYVGDNIFALETSESKGLYGPRV